MNYQVECCEEHALKFWTWIHHRGGVAQWRSADLGDPGKTWSTPYLDKEGKPTPKQTWKMKDKPEKIVTDPAQVRVYAPLEMDRFHVAVKRGSGLQLVLTDASARRLKSRQKKLGDDSFYEFDYSTQEAVLFVNDWETTLLDYAEKKGWTKDTVVES